MPGRNGTGPMGQGPMTGRGMGWCGGASDQADTPTGGSWFGMGRGGGQGAGWGGGRRLRNRFHATGLTGWQRAQMGRNVPSAGFPPALSRDQEVGALKQRVESIESILRELKSMIQEIAGDATGKEPR